MAISVGLSAPRSCDCLKPFPIAVHCISLVLRAAVRHLVILLISGKDFRIHKYRRSEFEVD